MRLKSLAFAAGVASMALVASGAAFAQSNGASEASAMTNDVSNFLGRVVMGKNDQLLGVIFQTQEAGDSSTVYLYTTTNLGLKGKVVTLPASMFAKQASESRSAPLMAPSLTKEEIAKMPVAAGAVNVGM